MHVQPPSPGSPLTGEVSWCGDPPDSPFALLNTSQVRPLAQNYQVHHQPHQPIELPTTKGLLCSFTYKCWVAGCGGETTQPSPALEGPPGGRITTLQTNPAILAQGSLTNCCLQCFVSPCTCNRHLFAHYHTPQGAPKILAVPPLWRANFGQATATLTLVRTPP